MTPYISILRGINVSGQKIIKMDALRKSYEHIGLTNVTTYLQSGNVIFTHESSSPAQLSQTISLQIEKDFGFTVPVIVFSITTLKKIIADNPFAKESGKEPSFLHVTFLSSPPDKNSFMDLEEKIQHGEEISMTENAIYLYCPNGYGKTKLSNNFLETRLKVTATTRNWKTTNELLNIAQKIG